MEQGASRRQSGSRSRSLRYGWLPWSDKHKRRRSSGWGMWDIRDRLIGTAADEFAKRVNEALKERYEVKVFHSSQLGPDEEMLKGIKMGFLEMFEPSTVMSTVDQRFGIFEMPYLFKDRGHVKRIAEDPKTKEILFDPLQEKGLRILGMWENGFRVITNNVRPIVKPQDLKGIKLRVPSGVWRVKMFRLYGANPTPLAYGEVFAALQAGVMDGQENPFPQIYGGEVLRSAKVPVPVRPCLHPILCRDLRTVLEGPSRGRPAGPD